MPKKQTLTINKIINRIIKTIKKKKININEVNATTYTRSLSFEITILKII
jgi:hypothetical protein